MCPRFPSGSKETIRTRDRNGLLPIRIQIQSFLQILKFSVLYFRDPLDWSTLFKSTDVLPSYTKYDKEQNKLTICPFMKKTIGTLRCPKGPKTIQHTLELLHVYWYILDLFKEVL